MSTTFVSNTSHRIPIRVHQSLPSVVKVKVKVPVTGPVQDMKLAMSVYKYITASVKEPTSDPRRKESDRYLWPEEQRNQTYNHSGVIDERSGV